MSVTGYFRAPFAMGFSPRPGPDNQTGPTRLQVSYGPNRTVDASYYSFAYTRLQEQDWAELFVHAKKKHVEAVVGWMGYWFQAAGFRNPDAAWAPGVAYLTLDSDFDAGGIKPNIALTVGSWWPKFGQFAKYDTYTLGQMRQLGEQLRLTLPLNPDLTMTLVQGFGTNRDGSYNNNIGGAPPIYGATTGMDLLHYDNIELAFKKYVDLGLHFNTQWTRDPNLTQQTSVGAKSYEAEEKAYLMTIGGEVTLSAPYAGRLWLSPSYIKVRNGWALANGGVEVMHSLGGAGLGANYFGLTNSTQDSSGSGSLLNLGFLYENSLSGIKDKPRGSVMPDLTLNVFGLMANASLDLPAGSAVTAKSYSPIQVRGGLDTATYGLARIDGSLRPSQFGPGPRRICLLCDHGTRDCLFALYVQRKYLHSVLPIPLRQQYGAQRAMAMGTGARCRKQHYPTWPVFWDKARRGHRQGPSHSRLLSHWWGLSRPCLLSVFSARFCDGIS